MAWLERISISMSSPGAVNWLDTLLLSLSTFALVGLEPNKLENAGDGSALESVDLLSEWPWRLPKDVFASFV